MDTSGNTPLHMACEDNQVDMAMVLVESGANVELQNKSKKTPLELFSDPAAKDYILRVLNG
jgi:26S proteasome non-ATPase regulatory subunit 10